MRLGMILFLSAAAVWGQRHHIDEVNAEKPEGKLLQQIMQEDDTAKKIALLDQFTNEFPKHEAAPWVLEQLQGIYVKANDPDKIIAAGEKLLAIDPEDPEAALQCLKAAESRKDTAAVTRFGMTTGASAHKLATSEPPKEAAEMDAWKAQVAYAKQVEQYADYALYRTALESRDPKLVISLGESVRARNAGSEYAAKIAEPLFVAYRQANDQAKALALADQMVNAGGGSEDMLLVLANQYMEQKKEAEKIHSYSARIVQLMGQKAKPEGVSDVDWNSRRNLVVGLAHYMSGKQYHNDSNFAKADVELRAALPLVEGNAAIKPEVL
ncbi:MAG: hypothetical protein ABI759_01405 [Candidatus Solibacter sp.]